LCPSHLDPVVGEQVGARLVDPISQSPAAVRGRYLPALDGVRALAIVSVLAYHLGFGWAQGGYLGVDLFFVLSGFLITGLLLEEHRGTGRVLIGRFWARRARRLLPGLLLMIAALSIWVAFNRGDTDLSQLRGDAFAAIFYFSNWHLLLAHQSYFTQFAAPSPLQHTWSLAIEEQFYLVWPLVVVALFGSRITRRKAPNSGSGSGSGGPERWRSAGLVVTMVGTASSAAWMAYLAATGAGVNRIYYGTDTRAFDLMAGAAAAVFACWRPQPTRRMRNILHRLSPLCLALLAAGVVYSGTAAGGPKSFMFYGGFLVCAIAASILLLDVRQADRGLLGKLLSVRPIRWLGKISYGLYLWHWPVIVELNPERTGLSGLRLAGVQVAVTFAAAALSFYLVERPLRTVRLPRVPKWFKVALVPAGMCAVAASVVLATIPADAAPSEKVVVSASAPGAGHIDAGRHSVDPTIALPAGSPSRAKPLRVMLIGDSVMGTETPAIEAALESTGEAEASGDASPGWGLTTGGDRSAQVSALIRIQHPQLVIAMWQWDNFCLLESRPAGSCALDPSQYRALLTSFIRTVLSPKDGVAGLMFEQYPPLGVPFGEADPDQKVAGVAAWDSLVASMAQMFPGRVMYVPVAPAVELRGQFAVWLPPEGDPAAPDSSWVRVRMLDDTHFCPAGAARYAGALVSDLTILYRLSPPAPGWSVGSWTKDAVYNEQPGSCPDDHP
jgi:peptidoglycan/LPS O-acetylase OafA/YrhL